MPAHLPPNSLNICICSPSVCSNIRHTGEQDKTYSETPALSSDTTLQYHPPIAGVSQPFTELDQRSSLYSLLQTRPEGFIATLLSQRAEKHPGLREVSSSEGPDQLLLLPVLPINQAFSPRWVHGE